MPVAVHIISTTRFQAAAHVASEQIIQRHGDALAVELATLWETLFLDLRDAVKLQALRDILASGSVMQVEAFLSPFLGQYVDGPAQALLPSVLLQTVQSTATAMAPSVAVTLGAEATALALPASVPWLAQYAGTQIVQITRTTQQAIRATLRTEFAAGTSTQRLAQTIKAEIGLTPRQTQTVERLRSRLQEQGVPVREAQRQVANAGHKGVQQRALTIARTEAMDAANAGQQELWRQAVRNGYMVPEEWQRQWLTAQDERVCPICAPMNGQRRGLEEPFMTGSGLSILFPTAHPNCRCTLVLVAAQLEVAVA